MLDDDYDGPPLHPKADVMIVPKWDEVGRCICEAELPAMKDWNGPGGDWAWINCAACGTGFVDEETFIAIYDEGIPADA